MAGGAFLVHGNPKLGSLRGFDWLRFGFALAQPFGRLLIPKDLSVLAVGFVWVRLASFLAIFDMVLLILKHLLASFRVSNGGWGVPSSRLEPGSSPSSMEEKSHDLASPPGTHRSFGGSSTSSFSVAISPLPYAEAASSARASSQSSIAHADETMERVEKAGTLYFALAVSAS
jgi:hypothetical protein